MKKFFNYIKKIIIKLSKREYLAAFLTLFLASIVVFSLEGAGNWFTLPMTGDYSLQTYSFYTQGYNIFWNTIKTGKIVKFDFSNYLGANFYGSQSFYYLFSPLFYLLCLWPKALLYQGIFFHMAFKYALGGFFFFILLRKYYKVSFQGSWIGGFIYAFSGWSLFYVWFHFSDILAFFPLFLLGIETLLRKRKGWLLTLSLFLCGISNYFFEVNFIIFGFFYSIYRWIYIYGINKKKGYDAKTRWGVLFEGMFFYLAGILLACYVLLPSIFVASSSNRSESTYLIDFLSYFFKNPIKDDNGYSLGALKSIKEIFSLTNINGLFKYLFVFDTRISVANKFDVEPYQQIGYVLSSWLFMNTNCWTTLIFNTSSGLDNSIGGMFISTPLTIMLIPSLVRVIKEKRPWQIFGVIVCMILPFIPITYYVAFGFTQIYGRWFIWIVALSLILIIPTVDKYEEVDRRWVTVGLIINLIVAIILIYLGQTSQDFKTSTDYLIVAIVECVVMVLVWFIYRFKMFKPKLVKKLMICIVICELSASMVITLEHKGFYKWNEYYYSQESYKDMKKAISDIQSNDSDFYRIYNSEAIRTYMNLPSTLNYNGASGFTSCYNFELRDYIKRSKAWYNGGWTFGYHEKRYYQDEYLGIKYYIVDKKDPNNDNPYFYKDETAYYDGMNEYYESSDYSINIPWGYNLVYEYDNYQVYENTNYINMGYMVDNIVSSATAGSGKNASVYDKLYLDTAIVSNDDYTNLDYIKVSKVNNTYHYSSQNDFNTYLMVRKNYTDNVQTKVLLDDSNIKQSQVESILPSYSQFLHGRKEIDGEKLKGDMFVLELKDGKTPICPLGSKDNKCYINVKFKMGPKALISLYHDDILLTQDAHHVSTNSVSKNSLEWKEERGFYVDSSVNKIVIEFVTDAGYEKVFTASGFISNIEFNYDYQNEAEELVNKAKENAFKNVVYKNDSFTFDTDNTIKKLAVTSIPYDSGWKLINQTTNESVTILNVNGGFVGFEANPGNNSYKLEYHTPYLKEGINVSFCGLIFFIYICYIYNQRKKVNLNNFLLKKESQYGI